MITSRRAAAARAIDAMTPSNGNGSRIGAWRHARAIALLPFMNTVAIPSALLALWPASVARETGFVEIGPVTAFHRGLLDREHVAEEPGDVGAFETDVDAEVLDVVDGRFDVQLGEVRLQNLRELGAAEVELRRGAEETAQRATEIEIELSAADWDALRHEGRSMAALMSPVRSRARAEAGMEVRSPADSPCAGRLSAMTLCPAATSGGALHAIAVIVTSRVRLGLPVALALLAVTQVAHAEGQTGTIIGVVTDRDTGAPLSTVQVFVEGTSIGSLTTNSGAFTLINVPAGRHTVVAQRIGITRAEVHGLDEDLPEARAGATAGEREAERHQPLVVARGRHGEPVAHRDE